MNKFFESTNLIGGVAATIFSAIFGKMWFLFAGFLFMNIVDWFSGWCASRKEGIESSKSGAAGILKKVWYWIVIWIAFYIAFSFEELGLMLGINLSFLNMIGWFVLANYLVNEIRSVLENLVRLEVNIPNFLIKGLSITNKMIEEITDNSIPENKDSDENGFKG